jgi:hypothetical protein
MEAEAARIIGFVGVAMVLVAYFANQQRWLSSDNWPFPLANMVGSCLMMVSLYVEWNLPSFVINGAWAAVSLWGLVRGMRARRPG